MLLEMLLCPLLMVMMQLLPEPALCSSTYIYIYIYCPVCFGPFFILLSEQCYYFKLRIMFLPSVYGILIIILKQCLLPIVFRPLIISGILYLLVFIPALHDTLWLHVIYLLQSFSYFFYVSSLHWYFHSWGLDLSITYICRGGILLLSQFFWLIPVEWILLFLSFVSNLHPSMRNLVT